MIVFVKLPSQRYLKECFVYEESTGRLFWRVRPEYHFSRRKDWVMMNKRLAGKEAFTYASKKGYHVGIVGGSRVFAHRVIWKLVTGKNPPKFIDHRNRDKSDNRWSNLRPATNAQNVFNADPRVDNTSGHKGVKWDKKSKKWVAYIRAHKKLIHLGQSSLKAEAVSVRQIAEVKYYGEFARVA